MTSPRFVATRAASFYRVSAAKWLLGSLLLAAAVFQARQAHASDVRFSIGLNLPGVSVVAVQPQYRYDSRLVVPQGYVLGADGVLYPQQVVVKRPNYYVQPAPVYVPRPVYVQPIRGYVAPVYYNKPHFNHGYRHGHANGHRHGNGHRGHGNHHGR